MSETVSPTPREQRFAEEPERTATLDSSLAAANADIARINDNRDLKTATWEESEKPAEEPAN